MRQTATKIRIDLLTVKNGFRWRTGSRSTSKRNYAFKTCDWRQSTVRKHGSAGLKSKESTLLNLKRWANAAKRNFPKSRIPCLSSSKRNDIGPSERSTWLRRRTHTSFHPWSCGTKSNLNLCSRIFAVSSTSRETWRSTMVTPLVTPLLFNSRQYFSTRWSRLSLHPMMQCPRSWIQQSWGAATSRR